MNELIDELVDEIKKDERYISFIEASKTLEDPEVKELLDRYQSVLEEVEYLKQFDQYIDNSSKKNELKEIKKEIAHNTIIQHYYKCYYDINELLQHSTEIVFKDISDSLNTTGFNI